MAQTLPTLDEVQKGIVDLYIAYFNRAPETKGLNDWTSYFYTQVAQGKDPDAVYIDMANQFFGLGFHFQALPPNLQTDNTALVKWAYQNVLGRDLDAEAAANTPPADPKFANTAEEAYQTWVPLLDNGMDKGSFFVTLIDVARNFENDPSWGWVYNYLEARNTLGLLFAKSKEGNITDPDQAITVGKQVLTGLTPDQVKANPNVDPQALAQKVFTQWEATQIGQTFRLTTGADAPALTAGNDTIDGTTTPDSLGSGDLIVDQGGTDTLNARLTKAWTASPTVVGVENVNLNLDMYSTPTLDVGGIKGATITLSTSKVITGDATVSGVGNNTIDAGSGFTGKLTAKDVTTGTILADQAKSVDVTGTSGADTINVVAGANTTSITVDGSGGKDTLNLTLGHDAKLTLSNFSGSGETVNLTAAGNATVTVSGGANVLNVLGSGDVTLKGGSGVFNGNTVTDQNAGKLDIVVTGTVSNFDASKLQADSISLTASGGTVKGADGQHFIVAASGGNVTFTSDTGAADTLNVKLTSKNYGTITGSDGKDTLVLTAAAPSGSGTDLTIGALSGSAAVILQGANDVAISGGATGITTLDAHALEGNLTIGSGTNNYAVSSGSETVVLGAQGDNTITFGDVDGSSADTALVYTGQGGKDDITLGTITSSGKDASVVLALGDGDDSVKLSDVSVSSSGQATLAIDAGAGDDTVTLDSESDYSGGTVSLTLGDGNDTLVIGSGASFTSGNFSVDFGGGSGDTLELQSGAELTGFNTFTISGLEAIKVDGSGATIDSSLVSGKTYSVTGAGYSNSTLTVTAHDDSGDVIDLSKLNVSDSASTGALISVSGGNGNDLITGTKIGDVINGGSGDDTIIGGAGADTLTGGAGDDLFIFGSGDASAFTKLGSIDVSSGNLGSISTITLSQVGAVDVIEDWGSGDDSIKFLNSAGSAVTKVDTDASNGVADDSVLFLRGTYNTDGMFTADTGEDSTDVLAIYDVKAGDGVSYQAVVIVGGHNAIHTTAKDGIFSYSEG